MRRTALVALVSFAVLAPVTPAASDPFGAAGASQDAIGLWLRLGKKTGTMYVIGASRGAFAATFDGEPIWEAGAMVAVGKGPCKVHRAKHFMVVSCFARVAVKRVSPLAVDIDPLLSRAAVAAKVAGKKHRATWRGVGPAPIPGAGFEPPPYTSVGAGAFRPARVTGRVMGKTLKWKPAWDMAFLGEGAGAALYDDALDGDGTVTVHRRFDTRR